MNLVLPDRTSAGHHLKTRFGPLLHDDGVTFRLWAPDAKKVELVRQDHRAVAMAPSGEGFFEIFVPEAGPGDLYKFRIGDLDVPDPASRAQEKDADGWSLVVPRFPPPRRRALRPWREAVMAEVHVGAASPQGTFLGLIPKLRHFAEAGFTVLELMPVNEFMGRRNWGYDGVLLFAPDTSYGTPSELRQLIDAAHDHGLAIVIDVVYNHFGPLGNFLPRYASDFFTDRHTTPWGSAIALDNPIVRQFFIENAQLWLADYDADGLRFDAVHTYRTKGASIFLEKLSQAARAVKPDAFLILENDRNEARWLERREDGTPVWFTAQWNDDIHHVLYVMAGCDPNGHYQDYGGDSIARLGRALSEGFIYQGEESEQRNGEKRGQPSAHLPPDAFVSFVQNHDQIGNRPCGDRLTCVARAEPLAFLRCLLMLSPHPPLFFMGEEASLRTPFPFFCDYENDLAEAVRKGRREEFKRFFDDRAGPGEAPPDPLDPKSFECAKYPWQELENSAHAQKLDEFKFLSAMRRNLVWPIISERYVGAHVARQGLTLRICWTYAGGTLILIINPSDLPESIDAPHRPPDVFLGDVRHSPGRLYLGDWSLAFWSGPL